LEKVPVRHTGAFNYKRALGFYQNVVKYFFKQSIAPL